MSKNSCSTLIIHCIDYRFQEAINRFIEKKHLSCDYDEVSVAGSCKTIAHPEQKIETEFVLRQIELAKRLHHIHRVILINHTDCGAYGGRNAFPSKEAEWEAHVADLENGKKIIREHYPELQVEGAIADISEDEKEIVIKEV